MTIPVVFAANDNFAAYMGVAIRSLIMHCSTENQYMIYILYSSLSHENRGLLLSMKQENVSIECIDINNYIDEMNKFKTTQYLSKETYFRLVIPDIFNQYEKILYLDSDIAIKEDIGNFYCINIGTNALGAVSDIQTKWLELYYKDNFNLTLEGAFNAGILIINLTEFKKRKIKEKCLELIRNNKVCYYLDQDALNQVCRNDVVYIEGKWNFPPRYLDYSWEQELLPEYRDRYKKNAENVSIIHYAGTEKPWDNPQIPMGSYFWEIAEQSPFYEKLKMRLKQILDEKKGQVPLCNIQEKSEIILYGAGRKGIELWNLIKSTDYCNVILWVDKYVEKIEDKNLKIHSVSETFNKKYDQLVIAIENKKIAEEAKRELICMGVAEAKIAWAYKSEKVQE